MMLEVDSLSPEIGLELFKTVCLRERYLHRLQSLLQQKHDFAADQLRKAQQRRQRQRLAQLKASGNAHSKTDKSVERKIAAVAATNDHVDPNSSTVVPTTTLTTGQEEVWFPIDLSIIGMVDLLRETTVSVITLLISWEKAQIQYPHVIQPFTWNQLMYTEKMMSDCDFLASYPSFIAWLGFSPVHNPFLVPPELFSMSKTMFFLDPAAKEGMESNDKGENEHGSSYVIFGTKPILPSSQAKGKSTKSQTKSPYATPIINDPAVFTHLSVKNQLNQKFSSLSNNSNNKRKANEDEDASAELYQCFLSAKQVQEIRSCMQKVLENNQGLPSDRQLMHTSAAAAREDAANNVTADVSIGPPVGPSDESLLLAAQNPSLLSHDSENDHHRPRSTSVAAAPVVAGAGAGAHRTVSFIEPGPLSDNSMIFDENNHAAVDEDAHGLLEASDSMLNVDAGIILEESTVQLSAQQQEAAQVPHHLAIKSRLEEQSPQLYAYLDTLNDSQRLQPLSSASTTSNNTSSHPPSAADPAQQQQQLQHTSSLLHEYSTSLLLPNTAAATAPFPSKQGQEQHAQSASISNINNSSDQQNTMSQVWTPHELHLQRQVQRRGGELYVLTAAGNAGKMKAPRRTDRFHRLYTDYFMVKTLQEQYSMMAEDVSSHFQLISLEKQSCSPANSIEIAHLDTLLHVHATQCREYAHVLHDLSIREWYLQEQIVQVARVLAPLPSEKLLSTKSAAKNLENIPVIAPKFAHMKPHRDFSIFLQRFIHFQQHLPTQRALIRLQDGQSRLEDQQYALQVEDQAAVTLQTFVRRRFGYNMRRILKQRYIRAATTIQTAFRQYLIQDLLSNKALQIRLANMIFVLYNYRKSRALRVQLLHDKTVRQAVMLIQRCFRGYCGRRRLQQKRSWLQSIAMARVCVSGTQLVVSNQQQSSNNNNNNNIQQQANAKAKKKKHASSVKSEEEQLKDVLRDEQVKIELGK